jgi:hypothetical protein
VIRRSDNEGFAVADDGQSEKIKLVAQPPAAKTLQIEAG